jgi:hypothetical protein
MLLRTNSAVDAGATEQIVGPERRLRVLHHRWPGKACLNSRRPVNSTVGLLHLMRRQILNLISVTIVLCLTSCFQLNKFNHQPTMARGKAEQFADAAFVERDLGSAYGLLSQAMRNQLSFDQFKDLVSKMHPAQYPDAVNATEYEPLMGRRHN